MKPLSPWQPDTNKKNLAVLGKLLEELNECGSIAARCIIQGMHEKEPSTKELNIYRLEKEIADTLACIELAINHFNLDENFIHLRRIEKINHRRQWHKLLT